MKMVQRCCARVSRVSSQSRCRAQFLAATWPTDTAESFTSRARLLAAYPRTGYSSNRSPSRCRPASRPREPQARPLAVASAPTRPLAAYPRWNSTLSPPSSKLAAPTRRLTAALSTHSSCHCLPFGQPAEHSSAPRRLNLHAPPLCASRLRAFLPSQREHTSSSPLIKLRQLLSVPFEQETNPQAVDAFVANERPFDNFVPHSEPFPTPSATSSPAPP